MNNTKSEDLKRWTQSLSQKKLSFPFFILTLLISYGLLGFWLHLSGDEGIPSTDCPIPSAKPKLPTGYTPILLPLQVRFPLRPGEIIPVVLFNESHQKVLDHAYVSKEGEGLENGENSGEKTLYLRPRDIPLIIPYITSQLWALPLVGTLNEEELGKQREGKDRNQDQNQNQNQNQERDQDQDQDRKQILKQRQKQERENRYEIEF
jgi:hypothetical protein